ncbi:MAG: pirin family protein [Rubrivivax sp.]
MAPAPTPRITLQPHGKDLGGGFTVRRLLPAAACRSVGPFIFFDHFGPVEASPSDNHDVRPHPHIGLSTVTYLFEGAMMHRDSLGKVQRIEPGAINWMTAGRGIVHSERTPEDLRGVSRRSHGLQLWAALPEHDEEIEPSFAHTPAAALPVVQRHSATVRLLVGAAWNLISPVMARSPTLYLDIALQAGAQLALPLAEERAVYGVDAPFSLDGEQVPPLQMVLLRRGEQPVLSAQASARVMLIGGQPLGARFLNWNFVSSRRERIEQAREDWRAGRFAPVPGETEFIPLPD